MEKERAVSANNHFENHLYLFLKAWARSADEDYLATVALRDFFLLTAYPLQALLAQALIAGHLCRSACDVYFDPVTGDPMLACAEQRIYNLARRVDDERQHVPFRSVQPNKQTEEGDIADISTYPLDSAAIRYNSGNHFSSRPANGNVFEEHSRHSSAKTNNHLFVLFRRGFLTDRLHDVKAITAAMRESGETQPQFFVICSRHAAQEGHFGASMVIMDPANPDFPKRVLICDTLLKELPQHPRWWHFFVAEYSQVFGEAVAELLEDISHPLQKVNIKGDEPYRHDWDCPYYVASMTDALAELAITNSALLIKGSAAEIHQAMKSLMPDYYHKDALIKDRANIQSVNREKRWNSGCNLMSEMLSEITAGSVTI